MDSAAGGQETWQLTKGRAGLYFEAAILPLSLSYLSQCNVLTLQYFFPEQTEGEVEDGAAKKTSTVSKMVCSSVE